MKRLMLLIMFLVPGYETLYAQTTKSTLDMLTAPYMWMSDINHLENLDQYYYFKKFSPTTLIDGSSSEGEVGFADKHRFYLSDTIPDTFDESKVGTVKNGKYIIVEWTMKDGETMDVWEIISLNEQKWVMKYTLRGHTSKWKKVDDDPFVGQDRTLEDSDTD